jgi:hypothetical protein
MSVVLPNRAAACMGDPNMSTSCCKLWIALVYILIKQKDDNVYESIMTRLHSPSST